MILDIIPFKSVGPLVFGMKREEIIAILGQPDKEVVTNPIAQYKELYYKAARISVSLSRSGRCNAVFVFPPKEASINGRRILPSTGRQAVLDVQQLDSTARMDEGSLVSALLGLAVHVPDLDSDLDEPPQSILVHAADYYEGLNGKK